MRRVLRIARAGFAAVSLLLCVATAGLWVRSYFVTDVVEGAGFDCLWTGSASRGRVAATRYEPDPADADGIDDTGWQHRTEQSADRTYSPADIRLNHWDVDLPGFAYASRAVPYAWEYLVVVHLAYPTTLFALAPLAWLAGFRRRRRVARRARAGLCAKCGYDLRASAGRCPECGTVPAR